MLRVFENKVLRKIFGPKREDVTAGWEKLHKYEFRHLYSSPNIILVVKLMRISYSRDVTRVGETRIHSEFWWRSLREKHPWKKWVHLGDNIEIGLKETRLEVVDWINLAQDRDDLRAL